MIPLSPDNGHVPPSEPPEHCCFCAARTRLWFQPKDVAVCARCGETRNPSEVPDKEQWCDSPQGRGISPKAIVADIRVAKRRVFLYSSGGSLHFLTFDQERERRGPITAEAASGMVANLIGERVEALHATGQLAAAHHPS